MVFAGPIGIERHADHIELASVLEDDAEVPVVERLLVSAVEM